MRRFPAYDPPEYVSWGTHEELRGQFEARLSRDADRATIVKALSEPALLAMYRGLVRFRLHDIALRRWVKQGIISKAWLGTGEEAVTVGAVHALKRGRGGDVVAPMIRNAGACHEMGMPLSDMLRVYLGTADAPTRGRDLHLGDLASGVVAPVSMVGSVSTVVNGYALAFKVRGEDRIGLTWIGDGSTKTGEVHEALNLAGVLRLPVVFVIQNNRIALGTRLSQHHRAPDFRPWGAAYGMPLHEADGNNVLDVFAAVTIAARACRAGAGPAMVLAETFRMGGHATHDEREAREMMDPEEFRAWGRRDPIGQYEEYLARLPQRLDGSAPDPAEPDAESWNRKILARIEREVAAEVEAAASEALRSRDESVPRGGDAEAVSCYG